MRDGQFRRIEEDFFVPVEGEDNVNVDIPVGIDRFAVRY